MVDLNRLTDEQLAIVKHPVDQHARVLAGPGTGKSFTAMMLLGRLVDEQPELRTKMLTFSRAATASFRETLKEAKLSDDVMQPSTLHSHALSVLRRMRPPILPDPIRIPDDWEVENLIRPSLLTRIKQTGHTEVTPTLVKLLEGEMAAGWESFEDDPREMYSEITPELRAIYDTQWKRHRAALGYTTVSELSYRAAKALRDVGEGKPLDLDLLIVDEYQDLNRADIALIREHARLGVKVLAIGDDDQSIYGWRWAHPQGIRDFLTDFDTTHDYTLSICQRFGRRILDVANLLMAGARKREGLTPATSVSDGVVGYLWFENESDEVTAILDIIAARRAAGVAMEQVLLLVRSKPEQWFAALQPRFEAFGVRLLNVEWVGDAVADERLRAIIAMSRLLSDPTDSLAWLTLTKGLTRGIGDHFVDEVYESRANDERWGDALLRNHADGFSEITIGSAQKVETRMKTVIARLGTLREDITHWREQNGGASWSRWLETEIADADWLSNLGLQPASEEAMRLLTLVGGEEHDRQSFEDFVSLIERNGQTLALEEPGGVRLMTLSKSKGLTVDTAIILGLESRIIPHAKARDMDEERRLLYVGLTRAREMCLATMVSRRTSRLAFIGGGNTRERKSRSSLLDGQRFGEWTDGIEFVQQLPR